MKVLKNCHCANFRVCSKRQVFCHLFSWTCCIKVWNYWLKKTTTNFTMLSVQTVLLVSQYRIYIFIIHKIYMLHTFNMFCKCSFDRKGDHLPFFFLQYCLHVVYECRQHPRKPDIMSCI